MTRRELLRRTTAALAAGAMARIDSLTPGAPATTSASSRCKLHPFHYGDVKLTAGPLKEQCDHALDFFLKLDEDRILKVYRQTAGLPAPGPDMGGWYNLEGFGPGHGLGQWMSALSRFAAGLERVLYNGILAAKRIQPDGSTFYYSDYQDGARKTFHPDKWPCCAGTCLSC